MNIRSREPFQSTVALLYDPIPLDKITLDGLKKDFPKIQSLVEDEFLYIESAETKTRAHIFSARLDYLSRAEADFSENQLRLLSSVLSAMPPLRVKGIGVNLHVRCSIEGVSDAGIFTTKRYLRDAEELEKRLGSKIIASAQRITYGEPSAYYDLRVTPKDLGGELLQVHLRKHRNLELTDPDRIVEESLAGFNQANRELARLLDLL